MRSAETIMQLTTYAESVFCWLDRGVLLAREEDVQYDSAHRRAREAATNALRAENATLLEERAAREQAKERQRITAAHGPRVRFELVDGLHPKLVDEAIARGRRAGDIGHRTVAFYLADCADRGLFQELGHASVISYAVKRHHLSRRSARSLIITGRALRELRKIDGAFIEEKISWTKVRAIAKIADPSTEDAWLAFALAHTVDEIEKAAALAKKGEKPREDRKGLPEVRFDVRLRVSALLHEQYLLARQRLGAESGRDVTDEEFAGAVLETFLRRGSEGIQSSDSLYRVILDLRPADGKAAIRSEDGPVDLDAAMADAICCDAGALTEDGHAHGHYVPPIPDWLRRRILARDGHRCRVCGSRFQLHVHHIVFRSETGSSNAWSNLMAACIRCHALVHGGFLTITGQAPDRLEVRDRRGELLSDPARLIEGGAATALEIAPAPPQVDPVPVPEGGGPRGPGDFGFSAEKPPVATGPVDWDWVVRNRHRLTRVGSQTA
jgi:HNH endonuclease